MIWDLITHANIALRNVGGLRLHWLLRQMFPRIWNKRESTCLFDYTVSRYYEQRYYLCETDLLKPLWKRTQLTNPIRSRDYLRLGKSSEKCTPSHSNSWLQISCSLVHRLRARVKRSAFLLKQKKAGIILFSMVQQTVAYGSLVLVEVKASRLTALPRRYAPSPFESRLENICAFFSWQLNSLGTSSGRASPKSMRNGPP